MAEFSSDDDQIDYQVNETDGIYPVVINHTGESKKYNDEGNLVDGDRCSKPYISYKLYKDGVADPIKEDSGPAPLTVNLEKGKYYIETYAYADTFVDSDKASGFAAESTSMVTVKSPLTYYVKNTGSDIAGSGNGSKKKPYRTIQKCIDEIYADYNAYDHNTNTIHTVEMLSNLTAQDGDTFTNNAFIRFKEGTDNINKALNYVLEGHGYTINASQKGHVIMTVSNTIIGINNVNITGGITDSNFGYKNGGGILCAGGIVTMNAGSITGCHSCLFGGAVYVFYGKAITLNGVTITGNTADNAGGGVYIPSGHHDGSDRYPSGLRQDVPHRIRRRHDLRRGQRFRHTGQIRDNHRRFHNLLHEEEGELLYRRNLCIDARSIEGHSFIAGSAR